MKNKFFVSLVFSFVIVLDCFAQSKKEQIEQLNHIIDSISNVANIQKIKVDSLYKVEFNLKLKNEQNQKEKETREITIMELESAIKKLELEKIKQNNDFALRTNKLQDSLVQLTSKNINSDVFFLTDFAESYIDVAEPNFDFDFQKNESNDEKITGLFKSFWPKSWSENNENGSKKIDYATGEYRNGLRSGFWKYKLCNGEVQYEGNYINGLKHGKWYNYDFCNNALEIGFLEMIYTTSDYYQLELLGRISKEEITFEKGKPNDILYYLNSENNVILKINHKTGQIFYDNDQPLTNQTIKFKYPTFIGLENKELIIYHRNGTIAYKMTDIGTDKSEFFYNDSESLLKKCVYTKGIGNCQTFTQSGMVIDSYQYEFGSEKFGDECPCQ